jgi:type II secretory pathway pseudopilin PulG
MAPTGASRLPGWGRREPKPAGPSARGRHAESGGGLVELLVALSLAIVMIAAAIPKFQSMVHESRLRGAAFHLRGLMRQVRAKAAAQACYMGVVFDEVAGDPVFSIHADGNANGIRRMDVDSGVDPRLREPYRLSETFPGVRYGSRPAGAPEPFERGIQIGRSHIVSFSPLGSSTTGTLYLSNDYGLVYAVVIFGGTGRVRVARYRGGGKWQSM